MVDFKGHRLLSVKEALERLLAFLEPTPLERVPLSECVGRVLGEDIISDTDLPPFDNSAMDGYAVRAEDVRIATPTNPVTLLVAGDVSAGDSELPSLKPNQALRIATGARLVPGADAVVPIEMTSQPKPLAGEPLPENIEVIAPVEQGAYVRRVGQDVRSGSKVLALGHRLRPADVSLMAALGVSAPRVHCRPRVAILSTGSELVEPGQPLPPGAIRDANSYGLMAACRQLGADATRLGIAPDRGDQIAALLDQAVEKGTDLLVSSAGVSVGASDFIRQVIERNGMVETWRVNMRPGKPLLLGRYREVVFVGLPGNPVSALVTFEVFLKPAIERLSGLREPGRDRLIAVLAQAIESDGRESYLRGELWWEGGEYRAKLTGSQDSAVLTSLVEANALLLVPAGIMRLDEGERIEAWPLGTPRDWRSGATQALW